MKKNLLPPSDLQPLAEFHEQIREFADRCEPDHFCEVPKIHRELHFKVLDLEEHIGETVVGVELHGVSHIFTDWSRKQLLDHFGTREKWFKRVTMDVQAKELARRTHTLDKQRLRIMRSYVEEVRTIRGLVSEKYAEIADVDITEALCLTMPNGSCLRNLSGKNDKASYIFTLEGGTLLRLGPNVTGFPGAVIKNSEVGYGALAIVPYFVIQMQGGWLAPVALRRQALLRRVHRGEVADLQMGLRDALKELQAVWGPMQKRLDGLLARTFSSEQDALDRLQAILTSMRRTKPFIEHVTTTYSAAKNTSHNGLTIFMALLAACATKELDQRYDDAEVAGYMLLQLV